jgi:hypothetical protein
MYFLSFQYVKELDPGKPEFAENNGIEPLLVPIFTGIALPLS